MVALDDLWTQYLSEADRDDQDTFEGDLPTLMTLAEQLDAAIGDAAEGAEELRIFLDAVSSDDVYQAYVAMANESALLAAYGERLDTLFPDYELRGAIIESCIYVRDHAGDAQAELRQKTQALAAGGFATGDIPAALKCAGFLMAVGGGIATIIASGGSALLLGGHAATAAGGAIAGWEKSGCAQMLRDIGGGRR